MALMPISPADKEFLLQVQFRSMTDTYRRNFPAARYDISTSTGGRWDASSPRSGPLRLLH